MAEKNETKTGGDPAQNVIDPTPPTRSPTKTLGGPESGTTPPAKKEFTTEQMIQRITGCGFALAVKQAKEMEGDDSKSLKSAYESGKGRDWMRTWLNQRADKKNKAEKAKG